MEDQDFYQCDFGKPIVIEVAVQGLPDELTSTSKFGLFLTDKPGFEGATDPVDDGRQPCITIRLTVADGLDPVWEVYKDDRAKRIGAGGIGPCSGRARFSAHRIRRSPGLGVPAFGGCWRTKKRSAPWP